MAENIVSFYENKFIFIRLIRVFWLFCERILVPVMHVKAYNFFVDPKICISDGISQTLSLT